VTGLSAPDAAGVLALVSAATTADGVVPLSEATLLHLHHDRASSPRHVDLISRRSDRVAGYAHLDIPVDTGEPPGGELVVHPDFRRLGIGRSLLDSVLSHASGPRVWAHGDLPSAAALARSAGWTRVRALWQMRRSLDDPLPAPVLPGDVTLRTFQPGKDEQAWLETNHRAFAHHPEQGSWTADDLSMREKEDWFDPAGFFLAERGGRLVGFHWTKVHAGVDPMGEVYVVGVNPDAQGGGLGRALTLTGLRYLRERGLHTVLLYVDEDNQAAVRTYTSLGFTRWSTDAMYAPAASRDRPA
jgi:mycothiol synthase